jgi:hypothetical protein
MVVVRLVDLRMVLESLEVVMSKEYCDDCWCNVRFHTLDGKGCANEDCNKTMYGYGLCEGFVCNDLHADSNK